ncbi:MAG: hypothetical protein NZ921_05255 [Candidatus Caldarchaeum sp.]|nr:hypothetical protein [Candidatus Caldarchaeum sp.]
MITEVYAASEKSEKTVCNVCRGFARFCKISTCPYYRSIFNESVARKLSSKTITGPSPPTVLVGEKGYPKVVVGPAVSIADVMRPELLDKPREWLNSNLEDLLKLRLSLFFGRSLRPVKAASKPEELIYIVQESAASAKPIEIELTIMGTPSSSPGFGIRSAPYGPSAKIETITLVGNVSVPRRVDNYIHDQDISASNALATLYFTGFDEYYLSRVFSAGVIGRKIERKLVPTEWSITAVDDILSKRLYEKVRHHNIINEYRLHSFSAVENAGHIILTPTPWMYELLEGWLKHANQPPYSDHEHLTPRKTYAEKTGGAYYAVRFSILRHLAARKEQSGAIVFFEIYPRWIPLGVWRFREIVRKALEQPHEKFQTLEEAFEMVSKRLTIPLNKYIAQSKIIPFLRKQQKLG